MLAVRWWLVGGTLVFCGFTPLALAQEGEEKPGPLKGFTERLGAWRDNLFGGDSESEAVASDPQGRRPAARPHRQLGGGAKPKTEKDHDPFHDDDDPFTAGRANMGVALPPARTPVTQQQVVPPATAVYGQRPAAAPAPTAAPPTAATNALQQRLAASRAADAALPPERAPIAPVRKPIQAAPTQATSTDQPAARVARATAPALNAGAPAPDFEQPAPRAVAAAPPPAPQAPTQALGNAHVDSSDVRMAPAAAAPQSTPASPRIEPRSTSRTLYADAPAARREAQAADPDASLTEKNAALGSRFREGGVLFEQASPILQVVTSGPREIVVGKESIYKVAVRNAGQAAADEVAVRVRLPEWAEVVGTSSSAGTIEPPRGVAEPNSVTWFLPQVSANASAELTLRIIARRGKPFDLAIEYTHAAVVSETAVDVKEPKLSLAIAGPSEVFYGEHEVYKLTLSNPGTGDAENVVIRLAPTSPEDTAVASHTIGLLKAGDTKVLEIELNARRAGLLAIRAEAVADGGLQSIVAHDVQVRRADLDVQLAGPAVQYAGTAATYEVRIANTGNAPASNLQLAAMLPPGAKFLSATGDGRLESRESKILWRLASLRPGAEQVVQFKCQLLQPGANRHQVVCAADGDLRRSAVRTTDVQAVADLKLDVHDPPGPMPVGEDIVYEVTIRNRGTSAAEQVELVTFFSKGLEPISIEGGPRSVETRVDRANGEVSLEPLPAIAPGQEITLRITARATVAGTHTIRAELTCPMLEAKMTEDETTRFFDSEAAITTDAESPAPTEAHETARADWRVE